MNLKENEYQNYQLTLRAVGGKEILNRQHLKPTITKSGASFTLSLPSSIVSSGDYILTLKGLTTRGELEDVSESLFRAERKQ